MLTNQLDVGVSLNSMPFHLASIEEVRNETISPHLRTLFGGIFKEKHICSTYYSFRGITEQNYVT